MSTTRTVGGSANAPETGSPPRDQEVYHSLFQSQPFAVALFDCTTFRIADLSDRGRSLFSLESQGELPTLTDLLSPDDPQALADFCSGPPDAAVTIAGQRRGGAGNGRLSLRISRLPAPHDNLAQATFEPEPPPVLDASEGGYASIFAHAGIGLTVLDTEMRIHSMNPTIRNWFPEIDPATRPYCYTSFNSPPREEPCSYCPAVKVLKDGRPHSATTATPTPDGVRHYSMIATPVLDHAGNIAGVIETAEDVTDRVCLEQQLIEKGRNLQAVLDNAPMAIWYKDTTGRFRFVNKTLCEQMGIPEEVFLAAGHYSEVLPARMSSGCAITDRDCLARGRCTSLERFPFRDGKDHLVAVTKAKLLGEGGETLGVIGLGMDVTEQQLFADRLRLLTDSFLRFGPDPSANINVLTEVAGRILGADCVLFNLMEQGLLCSVGQWQAPADYRGSDRPEGHICYDLIRSGSHEPRIIRNLPDTPYAASDPNVLRYGLKTYLGVPVSWGEEVLGVLCGLFTTDFDPAPADLSFMQIVAAALGIEEARRRSVRAQRESERRYRALFSQAGEGVVMLSEKGEVLEVNQAFAAMHGYRPEELAGRHISDLDTPETLAGIPERMRRLLAGEHLTFEVQHYHRDGHVFPMEVSASIIDLGGERNIISFHRDITERKIQEEALKKSEHEFRLLADAMPQIVWITGTEGENLFTNDLWVSYTGLSREESRRDGWARAFHPDDLPMVLERWDRAVQGLDDYCLEARLRAADGGYRWWLVRGVPVRDDRGNITKWFGTCTDIDELKRAEEERRVLEQQFQQAQKLESLGVLAGGVAHDFNNILTIISGYCSLLELDPERCAEFLPEIAGATGRAAELCRQMLAYAGKTQSAMGLVDLAALVDEMIRMLRATLGQNVTIRSDPPGDPCFLLGDAGQVRQVLMNLVINASEAIGGAQGEIRVRLARSEIYAGDGETDHLGREVPPGRYLTLEVADNGCGMDEQTQLRLFEPFFSTKFSGRGLGMSAVLGIIKAHGGALQLSSRVGEGTRFRIFLPSLEGAARGEGEGAGDRGASWQGAGSVLLVEDEPLVRGLAATMLRKLGFEVVEACDGREGLERFEQHGGEFLFVMTDLGMPVMDGYQMFHRLKGIAPDLPVVISTGFGDVDVDSRIPPALVAGFLGKPYNMGQLREVVRRVVETWTVPVPIAEPAAALGEQG